MALGAIMGGASALSGLFGGGGPRAPRMNRCQQQEMQCNQQAQQGCCNRMNQGCNKVNECSKSFQGCPCGYNGNIGNQGMNGAGCCGNMNSWGNNSMNSMFSPQCGNNFGNNQFQGPQLVLMMGINMNA